MTVETSSRPAVGVVFNDFEPFAREVNERGPNVQPVIRVTLRRMQDHLRMGDGATMPSPTWTLACEASYLRLDAGVLTLVRLKRYLGSIWQSNEGPVKDERYEATMAAKEQVTADLTELCAARGLDFMDGSAYETLEAAR